MATYSNARAMRALIKASLQSIFKSPSAVVFSLAFPLVFILVFGFLGEGRTFSIKVANAPGSDTTSQVYALLHNIPAIKWVGVKDGKQMKKALSDGDVAASISITKKDTGVPEYNIVINGSSTQMDKVQQLKSIINNVIQRQDPEIQKRMDKLANVSVSVAEVKNFKTIDFILPGQLGFSLLAAGVFGTAFVFFNLRQTLVLKRFFATPVRREIIVLSEGIARMTFQILGSIVIIAIGHYCFNYTLINGWITFVSMLGICALGLMVFMGFGFIISGLVKNESSIPPLSNLVTLPQFLLAGTFFPIDNFPKWLQPLCKILPLTYLNDALRKVAFDGAGFGEISIDLLVLVIWGVVVYLVAGKVFKWE